jgi:thiol-disulfide isomerase/thioredoxin
MKTSLSIIFIMLSFYAQILVATPAVVPQVKALFTSTPIKIDGKLDESVWQQAQGYELSSLRPQKRPGKPQEKTIIYCAWDKDNFYVAAKCFDSDITATGDKDGIHHYNYGDVLELFLKPDNESWYWELYSTPANKKTTFFFPSKGRKGMLNKRESVNLRVASQSNGTLNNWRDKDSYWTTEMVVSRKAIGINGYSFSPDKAWRILIARYNYSRYLPKVELSCYPALSKFSFHYLQGYAKIILVKNNNKLQNNAQQKLKIISFAANNVADKVAEVGVDFNQPAQAQFEYGTTKKLGKFGAKEQSFKYLKHRMILRGLQPAMIYYYRVHGWDKAGNEVVSTRKTFKTAKLIKSFSGKLPWVTDYDQALKLAQKEHKKVFMLFTGSDWCPYCIRFDKNILHATIVVDYLTKNFIMLLVDFPHYKKLSNKQQLNNKKLAKKYTMHGVPNIRILDDKGKQIAEIQYAIEPIKFLSALKEL